jgi:hypothetical protein
MRLERRIKQLQNELKRDQRERDRLKLKTMD